MSTSKPTGVCRINRWTKNSVGHAERIENHSYESLAFYRHSVDLEFDEEVVKPERLTESPDSAGFNPDTMKVSKWYQEATRKSDVSHFSSSRGTSDAFADTDWTSYQVREPIEDDEERLAMKIGDTPPPLPRRVSNPRIRDDQALHEFFSNSDKMYRATSDDAYTQGWFDYSRLSVFTQSVRKIGKDVELLDVSTHPYNILFNNLGSFNRDSEFRKPANLNKPSTKGENFNIAELSLLKALWGNNYAHVIMTAEAHSAPTDAIQLFEDHGLVGCHSSRSDDLSVHARIDSTGYVRLLW